MALIKQGGSPNNGKITTTMGIKDYRAPVCVTCRERKEGQIYSRDPNGQLRCEDCAPSKHKDILSGAHEGISED